MPTENKNDATTKVALHPLNIHREAYDFDALIARTPELGKYVKPNAYGAMSIDFSNPKAVKWLNKALLKLYYDLEYWDIPAAYLCPPIPGRADYIHHIAELLSTCAFGKIPRGLKVKCMDIGVGASCVYPVIGAKAYGWSFVASDIDEDALASADKILRHNAFLQKHVALRLQTNPKDIFHGIMLRSEPIDVAICNPPFHASAEEATEGTLKKLSSLKGKKVTTPVLNFGGKSNELWCEGGEVRFILDMIRQSKQFSSNCLWFSTLVSKQSHLEMLKKALQTAGAFDIKEIKMGQGHKISRILAWTFLNKAQQQKWVLDMW